MHPYLSHNMEGDEGSEARPYSPPLTFLSQTNRCIRIMAWYYFWQLRPCTEAVAHLLLPSRVAHTANLRYKIHNKEV
ncbi:MAG: hypothetical protein HC804_05375 [Anaerolineae bacterium]|nr:hypothetical protein [Anaerolineae bacterium]